MPAPQQRAMPAAPVVAPQAPEAPVAPPVVETAAAPEPAPQARYVPPPAAAPRLRTCLIVDDSRVVRKVSRSIVEALGYVVIEAENGEEALNRCQIEMPQLILVDWDMPVMTGIDFVRKLRALPAPQQAKVVFCTSKGETHDIFKGIEAGADEYVTKPFDEVTIRTKLERIGAA